MKKNLTIEIHDNEKGWLRVGEVIFHSEDQISFEYDIDYLSEFLGNKCGRSVSITRPVDPDIYSGPILGFIMDLLPQGPQLKRLMGQYRIQKENDYYNLLKRCPLAPPGNLRIAEPWQEIESERSQYSHKGFTQQEIVECEHHFLDYMMQHGAPIGGSTGVAGGAPKFLLRKDKKGYFHAEGWLDDSLTDTAYLIKFPFTDSQNSIEILRSEKIFYDLMKELPIDTYGPLEFLNNVLFVPRFDRRMKQNKQGIDYYGLESFYSTHNIIIHGSALSHEENLTMIHLCSSAPAEDILEYFKRIFVNKFFSNPDNHGRNSSLIKTEGSIRLSPIYDVAPMQFFKGDQIIEMTRWQKNRQSIVSAAKWVSQQFNIDFTAIKNSCEELYGKLSEMNANYSNYDIPKEFVEKSESTRTHTLDQILKIVES